MDSEQKELFPATHETIDELCRRSNAHAGLVEALEGILFQAGCREARDLGNLNYDRLHAIEAKARAALQSAKGV